MLDLPIDPYLPPVVAALRGGRDVVLVAEPGAGKTTRVPPAVVRAGLADAGRHLVMLQPRRVAARAAASRIAEENGWQVGREVGYQVRFERVLTDATPLRVVTEGVLARRVVDDPSLEGVGVVVLDEFHERSLDADLCLAMLREARALRDDLRLIVMSATLDADAVAGFLGENVEVFHVPGRLFPVEIEYAGDDPRPIEERVAGAWRRTLDERGTGFQPVSDPTPNDRLEACPTSVGDVLVFLPGVREIEATMAAVARDAAGAGYDVLPLHGSLTKEEQDLAVRPGTRPRVICATNVAETSLTLPGVTTVIDSGLVRRAGYDAGRGVETLTTERISKASAEQRAGRAGRVRAGWCVRLWSRMTQNRLAAFDVPEVRRSDLTAACLAVRAWGGDPVTFGWFERPGDVLLAAADGLLELLGAVEGGRLTAIGRALQRLPLNARHARLVTAAPPGLRGEAVTAAALLGEGAEVPGRRCATVRDLIAAFDAGRLDPIVDRAVRRAREALRHAGPESAKVRISGSDDRDPDLRRLRSGVPETLEELLLLSHPDRVCRRRSPDAATMADGGGVRLPEASAVRGDWFVALAARRGGFARAQQADASLVAEIDVDWLDEHLPAHVAVETVAEWTGDRVVAVRRKRYRDLVISEQRGGKVDPAEAAAVLERELTADALDAGDALRRRVAMLRRHLPAHLKPAGDVDEADILADAVAAAVAAGQPSRAGVAEHAADAYRNRLYAAGWHRAVAEHAPTHLAVPTGSNIALDWTAADVDAARGPALAVRLQELFGLPATPRVCGGVVPVTLHLLAPNMRPQQVTDDLASFWSNTYPQVRRDLRARYPKHSWPEDPLAAPPVRGTGRRRPRRD